MNTNNDNTYVGLNDHDALVRLGTQMDYLIKEVQNLRDGVKKDILDLQIKVESLEKQDLKLENEDRRIELGSMDRAKSNSDRLDILEIASKAGVTRTESNRSYVWRKVFEWVIPFLMLLAGLVLARLNILNLK